nr:immunoglobulin heavy chain junction region [Mus musculus]
CARSTALATYALDYW